MQLTLQADDLRRFNEIVSSVVLHPERLKVEFIVFRGRSALAMHYFDWSIVMPIQGHKLRTPFKLQYRLFQRSMRDAIGEVFVKVHPKTKIGCIEWLGDSGVEDSARFGFDLEKRVVTPLPPEANELKEYPTAFLDDIWRCAKPCMKERGPYLSSVHVTPQGELRSTDGKYALGIQTPYTFDCGDTALIRSCELFGKKHLRRNKTFRMGFSGNTVQFDFGDFCFWSQSNIDRYPKLEKTFPTDDTTQCRLTLDPKDAAVLKKHVNGLPGRNDEDSPVTILCDYDNPVSVHGSTPWPDKTKAILLAHSKYEGDAYALQVNRKHLQQALSLGCLDFRFGKSYPFASTERIRFCCMPLDGGALPLESDCPRNPAVLLRSDQL